MLKGNNATAIIIYNNGLCDVSLERHIVIEIRVNKKSPHYHSCTDYILLAQFNI
jgi:hypothetical protein